MNTLTIIQTLIGADNFKEYCTRLASMADNLTRFNLSKIPIANLILSAEAGCGASLCLRLLAKLLDELQLLRFTGEKICFEYAYANDDSSFRGLINQLQNAAGFYGEFCGLIGINMMNSFHDSQPKIDKLLGFIDRLKQRSLIVFIIPHDIAPSAFKAFRAQLASSVITEHVALTGPSEAEMLQYTLQCCAEMGFTADASATKHLVAALGILRKSEHYAGYKTLACLANQILWQKRSNDASDNLLRAEDITPLFNKEGFISLFRTNERRLIGFGERRE